MVSEDVFCDQFLRFGITSSLAEWWWQAGRSEPAESSAGIECSTREHAQTLQIARRSVGPEQTTVSQRAKSEKPLSRHYNSSVLLENFFLPFFFLLSQDWASMTHFIQSLTISQPTARVITSLRKRNEKKKENAQKEKEKEGEIELLLPFFRPFQKRSPGHSTYVACFDLVSF